MNKAYSALPVTYHSVKRLTADTVFLGEGLLVHTLRCPSSDRLLLFRRKGFCPANLAPFLLRQGNPFPLPLPNKGFFPGFGGKNLPPVERK